MNISIIKRNVKNLILKLTAKKKEKYLEFIRSCYDYSKATPTILCSTCIGGMIYHNLGLQFMSPTINLWCDAEDLSKIAENPDKYLSGPIEFEENDEFDYPVGRIYDVPIYFTHYKTREEAAQKWQERSKRFNADNLYIITDDNGLTDEGRQRLIDSKHKRLIIFTDKETKDEYGFKVEKGYSNPYSVRDIWGFAPFEREFNYAAWLSDKDNYRMARNKW
ncbi:MAG: DUF1919 domain-containing protein [Clostridiales bacterium]|nr:DUF1919 domain-containing protein [Clostridiales bacterium]